MRNTESVNAQKGRIGAGILMWLLGVPIPVIIIIYLLMGGCT